MSPKGKKLLTLAIGITLILIAVVIAIINTLPPKKFALDQAYFTDDDGKTFYIDSKQQIPPYQHNGKEAVGVALYRTEKNATPFSGYLFRFPADLKKQLDNSPNRMAAAYGSENVTRLEVKKPKSNDSWVGFTSPQGPSAMSVVSPDGSELDRVLP